jgi:hypothetical protein
MFLEEEKKRSSTPTVDTECSLRREYCSQVERHFQELRGAPAFLLSPSDWKLADAWQRSKVPIEAVFRGIDRAFLRHQGKRLRFEAVNSLLYCKPEILEELEKMRRETA